MTRLLALTQAIEKMAAELAQELLREPAFREELKRRARQGVSRAVPDPLDALPLTLTLSELAALYRLSAATVRRQVQQGTLVQSGVDLFTVSKLLGHSDTKMTQRYAHLSPEHMAAAVAKLVRA